MKKIWNRNHIIEECLLGLKVYIYNGKRFLPVFISERKVGKRAGCFSVTKVKATYKKKKKKKRV
jgi:ribosomal protein S19